MGQYIELDYIQSGLFAELYLERSGESDHLILLDDGTGQDYFGEATRLLTDLLKSQGFGVCLKALGRRFDQAAESHPSSLEITEELLGEVNVAICRELLQSDSLSDAKVFILAIGNGAAAALHTIARSPATFSAVAISGGRFSSALTLASKNSVPTLFIIGSEDRISSAACEAAFTAVRGPKDVFRVIGAGHLLREPGAAEQIADRSATWFRKHA